VSDEKLKAAYSALPREEPRAATDAAILDASRRALARPRASRRWAGPVSIAAVLVLAFGVTLHMAEEKSPVDSPDLYGAPPPAVVPEPSRAVVPESPPPRAAEKPAEPVVAQKQKKVAPVPPAKPDRNEARAFQERDKSLRDEAVTQPESERKDMQPKLQAAPAEGSLAKESNVRQAPSPAAAPAARMKREAFAPQAPAGIRALDAHALDEPTRELEAIAKLRVEGRHEEADKALEEFRRKRPDYRIPEAMWERVKPR
jgi:hypothetical protein